jgi:N,N'-diacetyllegionaminate synthase
MRSFIIAEAGVNHNGSEALALKLVKEAYLAGADAVKFQTFNAESLVSKGTKTANYQTKNTGESDQFNMLKRLEMSRDLHIKLIDYSNELGIEFLSTPFDIKATKFLLNQGMKRIKIASGELTNLPFISELAAFNVPIILSTGMGSMKEVEDAINIITNVFKKNKPSKSILKMLTLLHCTSNYPTKLKDVNLKAMQTMSNHFSIPSGYSDHTEGLIVPILAVSMGATIIEKHLTLDKKMTGPDQNTSLNPVEFKEMIYRIREAEVCLGDGIKAPRKSELPIRDLVRRSVVLKSKQCAGYIVQRKDLILLRPGNGITPAEIIKVVGKKLLKDCDSGTTLQWDDLSS